MSSRGTPYAAGGILSVNGRSLCDLSAIHFRCCVPTTTDMGCWFVIPDNKASSVLFLLIYESKVMRLS